jgi:hypothetical protein
MPRETSIGPQLASTKDMLTETLENPSAARQPPGRLAPLFQRIEGEYHEMPGLKLTEAQAQRLWGLDPIRATSSSLR